MDPKLMEYFLRVAELKSINKAAIALNVSQPQLSRYIGALEQEIGAELFTRGQRGVTLTSAGAFLADRVRPILQQINALQEELGNASLQQVVLGMPVSLRNLVSTRMIAEVLKTQPHLQIRVSEGISNAIKGWVQNGLIDVGLVAFEAHSMQQFLQTPLVREPLVLIGSANTNLQEDCPVHLADLGELSFILPGKPNLLRHVAESSMRRRGLPFRLAVEIDSPGLCLELVSQGVGYTLLPSSSIRGVANIQGLRWAPVVGLTVTWAMTVNEARSSSPSVQLLARALVETARSSVESGEWPGAEYLARLKDDPKM